MKIKLYYNQYANGGAVDHEGWEAFDASEMEMTYGSCYSLKTTEVELPEGWNVAEICGIPAVVDETNRQVVFDNKRSDSDKIYVFGGTSPFARRLK